MIGIKFLNYFGTRFTLCRLGKNIFIHIGPTHLLPGRPSPTTGVWAVYGFYVIFFDSVGNGDFAIYAPVLVFL